MLLDNRIAQKFQNLTVKRFRNACFESAPIGVEKPIVKPEIASSAIDSNIGKVTVVTQIKGRVVTADDLAETLQTRQKGLRDKGILFHSLSFSSELKVCSYQSTALMRGITPKLLESEGNKNGNQNQRGTT